MAYLINSQAGLRSPTHAPDWVAHVTIADLLAEGEDPRLHRSRISPAANGPKASHYLAAKLSEATRLPPLRTVEIVVSFCLIVSIVLAAARSVWTVSCLGQNRAARIGGWLIAIAALHLFVRLGAGFYGQVGFVNYFYAQAVATPVALVALSILQLTVARGGLVSLCALASVPLISLMLVKIHFVPAVWFAAAGCILALSLDRFLLHRLAIGGALALSGAAVIFLDPATGAMVTLPHVASAALNLRLSSGLFQLRRHPEVLAGGLAALATLLWVVVLIEKRASLRFRLFNLHAGALAILGLGSVLLLILLFKDQGGYYPLAKFVYLFAAEGVLLLGHVGAIAFNRFGATPARPLWLVPALLLAVLVQQRSAPPYRKDQTLLIEMGQALRAVRPELPKPAPFPLDERLSRTDRLYLYAGAMGEQKVIQLLQPDFEIAMEVAKQSLPPSFIPRIVPGWMGEVINLSAIPDPSPIIFFGRWGETGKKGRAIYPPAAHLSFRLQQSPPNGQLCLHVLAPNLNEGSVIFSSFRINGEERRVVQFQSSADHIIELPLPEKPPRGDIVLSILTRSDSMPMNRDNYALIVQSLRLC